MTSPRSTRTCPIPHDANPIDARIKGATDLAPARGSVDPGAPGEYERVRLHRLLAAVFGHPRWPEVEEAEARRLAWERNDQAFNGVELLDDPPFD